MNSFPSNVHAGVRRLFVVVGIALCTLGASGRASLKPSKPSHVRQYTRKDGTVVHPYSRSLPGTATPKSTSGRSKLTAKPRSVKPKSTINSGAASGAVPRKADGRIARSSAKKRSFEASHPCPSTGKTSGPCPGYVVDHVNPLACGGADAPSNMQWQTTADGKAKDRTERIGRRAR